MMVSGGLFSRPVARKITARLRKKKSSVVAMAVDGLLGSTNVVHLNARLNRIEFADKKKDAWSDVDITKWKDVHGYVDSSGRSRKGLAQKLVGKAEFGGRTAADIYDYASRRAARNENARVGKFKITHNSRNTARITVGPDQRERRKKYVWERVGVQRQIAGVVAAGALVGGGLLHHKIRSAGQGNFGLGLKNILKGASNRVANAGRVIGGKELKTFTPVANPHGPEELAKKLAEMEVDKKAQLDKKTSAAAKSVASKLNKFGPSPIREPQFHPETHPDPAMRGKPILTKTGKHSYKLKKQPGHIPFNQSGAA